MGSLSFDGWGCVSVLLIIWHKVFTVDLQAVGLSWVLVSIWIPLERTYWLIFTEPRNSLVVQCPGLGVPTPKAQVQLLARESKAQKPWSMGREKRKKEKRKKKGKEKKQQAEAKTSMRNKNQHKQQHTHTHAHTHTHKEIKTNRIQDKW